MIRRDQQIHEPIRHLGSDTHSQYIEGMIFQNLGFAHHLSVNLLFEIPSEDGKINVFRQGIGVLIH
ncbi:hypothetical protein ACCUM_0912 [Candidatus Accumulibacter phosphatis]|uniref:Uncharacterized protein n=1 Tax=Candidatus Accumulibacter phosphatis TaxID=327160 RepID=A0A5S4EGP4_9PROT|nr:hypothetical protein ACCUM_0912 [Candidatus Accumulibacter phosphatis]